MNSTVKNFYNKEDNSEYYKKYNSEHSPRLDFIAKHFQLNQIKNQVVAEFGVGHGFFLSRLDNTNEKHGFDGILVPANERLCEFDYHFFDLDKDCTQDYHNHYAKNYENKFDASFCFETLEHLAAPYNALVNIKHFTKENAPIYVSIPDERVTHNVVYPALMFPKINFEEFLEQMALPIQEHIVFEGDWPAQIWKCKNAPWSQKKLKYPKVQEKFRTVTPLEATNI